MARPMAASVSVALVALLVFLRVAVLTGFDAVPGFLGDGLFNLAVLEHWYRVALGAEPWGSPSWFYPVPGGLGMSDALVLLAPPYVLARFAGAGPLAGLGLTQATMAALGIAGMLVFLRRLLGLVWPAALAGAVAFGTGTAVYESLAVGHVQLLAVELVPWFAAAALVSIRQDQARWPVAAALVMAGMLSTSFYVGWFVGLETLVLLVPSLLVCRHALPGWLGRRKAAFALALVVLAVALVPFAVLYGPVALHAAPRPWAEVASTLPGPAQLFEARGNALWGAVAEALMPGPAHGGGELGKGLSWGLTALFLGTLGRLAAGPLVAVAPATRRLALLLGASVLVGWLLMLDLGGVSLWALVYRWLPGGTGIRSVFRFNLVLAFPVTTVAAIGLDVLWRRTGDAGAGVVVAGALTALVMIEQVNLMPNVLSRSRDFALVDAQPPAPAACRSFVLLPAAPDPALHRWSRQMVAVLIAQARGIATLNGYSGMAPPGWALFDPTDQAGYRRAIVAWADAQGVWPGLCGLDPDQRYWFPLIRGELTR